MKKFDNIISITLIFILTYIFYRYVPIYNSFFDFTLNINFFGLTRVVWKFRDILGYFAFFYWLMYFIYYLFFVDDHAKPYLFWQALGRLFLLPFVSSKSADRFSSEDKFVLLNILVKLIYVPLILDWTLVNYSSLINYIYDAYKFYASQDIYVYYTMYLHWVLFYLVLCMDTTPFLIGYLFESRLLDNEIKSVEPTFLGWFVTLLCYPMLYLVSNKILNWYSNNYPDFVAYFGGDIFYYKLSMLFGILFIVFMFIYGLSSIALGTKASNLTNRGIVSRWTYSIVRHPAYISKNIARIIGTLPLIYYLIIRNDYKQLGLVAFSLVGWCLIYHFRAVTEEKHLSKDVEYIQYKNRVKHRYIPKIY